MQDENENITPEAHATTVIRIHDSDSDARIDSDAGTQQPHQSQPKRAATLRKRNSPHTQRPNIVKSEHQHTPNAAASSSARKRRRNTDKDAYLTVKTEQHDAPDKAKITESDVKTHSDVQPIDDCIGHCLSRALRTQTQADPVNRFNQFFEPQSDDEDQKEQHECKDDHAPRKRQTLQRTDHALAAAYKMPVRQFKQQSPFFIQEPQQNYQTLTASARRRMTPIEPGFHLSHTAIYHDDMRRFAIQPQPTVHKSLPSGMWPDTHPAEPTREQRLLRYIMNDPQRRPAFDALCNDVFGYALSPQALQDNCFDMDPHLSRDTLLQRRRRADDIWHAICTHVAQSARAVDPFGRKPHAQPRDNYHATTLQQCATGSVAAFIQNLDPATYKHPRCTCTVHDYPSDADPLSAILHLDSARFHHQRCDVRNKQLLQMPPKWPRTHMPNTHMHPDVYEHNTRATSPQQ